jgi:asparagine synthase (glutamine-hydrolysing)
MLSVLAHRGPDGGGVHEGAGAVLGHVRLAIIGIASGAQPMTVPGSGCWITYNGECFNYRELRAELETLGDRFGTDSDTEVVLAAYLRWGPDCLLRINGQFAFGVWNEAARTLFLARDRVGIRPLYYARTRDRFVFGSEIKSLLVHPGVDSSPDPVGLGRVFTLWGAPAPDTVFAGVRQLEPGHWMMVSGDKEQVRQYWSLPGPVREHGFPGPQEAGEELAGLLDDAVRLRLRSDVEVGAYVSGGLDSSIVARLAANRIGTGLRTFSLGFSEPGFDETRYQELFLDRLGSDNRRLSVTPDLVRDGLSKFLWHCECPVLRTAPVPLMLLSGLVRDAGIKVVLTGEGADEVFAGYNIFKEAKIRRFWARRPDSAFRGGLVRRLFPYVFSDPRAGRMLHHFYKATLADPGDPLFSHRVRWQGSARNLGLFRPEVLDRMCSGHASGAAMSGDNQGTTSALEDLVNGPFLAMDPRLPDRDPLGRAQSLEMTTFLSSYLLSSQGDRPAMANSVEIRLPFLDHRVMELAFALPAQWKMRGLNEKYLLKKTFGPMLPRDIAARTKHPYRAPVGPIFDRDFLEQTLSREELDRTGLFDPDRVRALIRRVTGPGATPGEFQLMGMMGVLSTVLVFSGMRGGSFNC